MQLFGSRDDDNFLERSIAMVRQGFGGNPFGSDQAIAAERRGGGPEALIKKIRQPLIKLGRFRRKPQFH
jgi:hypothetical protein